MKNIRLHILMMIFYIYHQICTQGKFMTLKILVEKLVRKKQKKGGRSYCKKNYLQILSVFGIEWSINSRMNKIEKNVMSIKNGFLKLRNKSQDSILKWHKMIIDSTIRYLVSDAG